MTTKLRCNGCAACCRGKSVVVLQPEDNSQLYSKLVPLIIEGKPELALPKNEKGECVYLGLRGCTIYSNRPWICRAFDCRALILMNARKGTQQYPLNEVEEAGLARLEQLVPPIEGTEG